MNRFLSWRAVGAAILCTALGWAAPAGAAVKPLHSFDGDDGRNPATPLLLASDGHWYGTTSLGGANGRGAVYRVAPDGSFGVVHAFTERAGAKDEQRVSGLTEGPDHAFYGSIAPPGIHHGGTLFRVTADGQYSVLHEFGSFDTREGRNPVGPPVPGPDGNFYGATHSGGLHGLGAVYRMTPAGEVTLIHSFDGTDGVTPNAAPVVSPEGEIFGTTTWGPGGGVGLVYRMGLSGENYSALHAWPTTRKEGVFPAARCTHQAAISTASRWGWCRARRATSRAWCSNSRPAASSASCTAFARARRQAPSPTAIWRSTRMATCTAPPTRAARPAAARYFASSPAAT